MRLSIVFSVLLLGGAALPQAARAFDPEKSCGTLLQAPLSDQLLAAGWMAGMREAGGLPRGAMDPGEALDDLTRLCEGAPGRAVADLVQPPDAGPASEDAVRGLLSRFLSSQADRAALTQELAPQPEDVIAVFGPVLGARLVPIYAELFRPGIALVPKPDQTALTILHTTTSELKSDIGLQQEFPGSYGLLLPYLAEGIPLVRFRFVRPGDRWGLAFEGLYFVHGRWVLMPKAWRGLES
ncbi:hypothetical protein [Pseudooceanicola nanhaiensis]|uniref:hypothetical protein n=1 Tax=Pseudooceanicola nanhaiensis TaxID=375761 RepID=UPI001CD631CE|nr:hypothetical protein [Pseudooceanicola nanhaiensis]MCA0919722.1 hypothetical protein [Pseudooceanicola nanhaiensis]